MRQTLQLAILTSLAATALATGFAGAADRDVVSLRSATIDATVARDASADFPATDVQVVKFPGPVTRAQRAELERSTTRVFTYLPFDAFLVRVAPDRVGDVVARVGASWSAPWLPASKLSPEISLTDAADDRRYPVMIHLFPDVDIQAAVQHIEELTGREVAGRTAKTRFARVRVLLSGAEIAALRQPLAEMPAVFWLERESRKVFLNDQTIWVGQSGTGGGGTTPVFDHGILGAGQVVGVLDTGIDVDSCYFRDPARLPAVNACDAGTATDPDHRKVLAVDFLWSAECAGGISSTEWDTHGHGTHVAGTIAGDDLALPGAHNGRDGMAPQARLVVQDCGYQFNDCADCPGIGCPVVDLVPVFEQPYTQGARLHTNSWGDEENDPAFGEYTSGCEDADTVMWNHKDYLLFFAAGNNGGPSNTVDSPSTAKSVISVGATQHGSGADSIASFSSRGPTDDGRIKPSITIVGSNVMSAANDGSIATDNCDDQGMSGTSMASPGAAGLTALVRQYFVDGFYPSGTADPDAGFTPSAALLRAALINSGEQMTGEGTIPNDTQGWGRILLDNVLYFPGDGRRLWIEDEAAGFAAGSSGESLTYQLNVASGDEPLEVTLAWTDFPSTPAASPNINNDLDLVVSGPGGSFLGNVFAGGQSTTGGSSDRINTLENVLVAAPAPGLWTVTVSSYTVPDGPQPFAVVATGDLSACSGDGNAQAVTGSEQLTITSGDGDAFLDNCESATLSFTVANTGTMAATDVSIVSVSSLSHPTTVFAPPAWTAASIDACAVDPTASVEIVRARGLSPDDVLLVDVELTNAEIAPLTRTTTLRVTGTETDLVLQPLVTFDFEADLAGWAVAAGTFARDDTLVAPSGSWYLQSSSDLPNQCDVIASPALVLTATSTLSLFTRYRIENGTPWYDRANISLVSAAGESVVSPDGGRPYDVPAGSANGTCGTAGEAGWAGSNTSWATSSFSAAALGSAVVAGQEVTFEVRYGTDPGVHYDGFAFDRVEVTDVMERVPDTQSDSCPDGILFADGFESGDASAWSAVR